MNARADVVNESGECKLGASRSASDAFLRFVHDDRASGLRKCNCRRQPVGPGADYNRVKIFGFYSHPFSRLSPELHALSNERYVSYAAIYNDHRAIRTAGRNAARELGGLAHA